MKNACIPILCAALAACATAATAPQPALEGAWKSSRELTLQQLRGVPDLSEEQLAQLSRPDFFGRMIQVYHSDRWVIVYQGQCASTPLQRLSSTADSVTVRFHDQSAGQDREVTLGVHDDRLVIPIHQLGGGAAEVFTRVSLPEVLRQHPCVAAALN